MIRWELHLKTIDWHVTVMYAVTCYNIGAVVRAMHDAGASDANIKNERRLIESRKLNQGLTYSNPSTRESVMVVALAESAEQYANSIAHERGHLVAQLTDILGLDWRGEDPCYMAGELAQKMYDVDSQLVCPHCLWRIKSRFMD